MVIFEGGTEATQIPRLHGDPIAGSNPGGGSDPSSGIALTRIYTVIPFTEQTPQLGQIGRELGVYITKFRALAITPVHVTYILRAAKTACIKSRYNNRFSTLFSVDGTVLYCYPQENAAVHKHS